MKHLKKNIISNISSNNNIVSKNSKNYADFGQKKKPTGLTDKKNRLFKSLGIGAMAVFMGFLTVLGTACTPAQTNVNLENGGLTSGNNTQGVQSAPSPLGLDPQNDPIIYTTESGLEIKYGGIDIEQSLASGALTGYPYFTMGKYDGYDVNWVIIGQNPNDKIFTDTISSFLFSTWKSTNNYPSGSTQSKAHYFFNNVFEDTSPAGNAISSVVASKSYIADITAHTKSLVKNAEIPSGNLLAYSDRVLGSYDRGGTVGFNYEGSGFQTHMNNLFETGLGLSNTEKNMVIPQDFQNYYYSGGTSYTSNSYNQKFFPLGARGEKFNCGTYLTTNALRIAYQYNSTTTTGNGAYYWLRSGGWTSGRASWSFMYYDGQILLSGTGTGSGTRPACIISLS